MMPTSISDTLLYGSDRESRTQALQLSKKLQASSILGQGEYNYTPEKLSSDVWQTSCKRDFSGIGLKTSQTLASVSQLEEHFRLGNDSGMDVPTVVYAQSTTADDFTTKSIVKPTIFAEDRTINWPDMSPQYKQEATIGQSEYANTFGQQNRSVSAPVYPKVKTATMQLPLDPTRFHVQRGSDYTFGNDERSKVSEHQRAFGRMDGLEDFSGKLASGETERIRGKMKALEKESNVFRLGDYNGAAGNVESTTVNDFGPRTQPLGEICSINLGSDSRLNTVGKNLPNMLTSYARDVTVPEVFRDADDGRHYQTNAHFQFGTYDDGLNSVYGKDFNTSATAARKVPQKAFTKDAGNILQSDPEFSHAPISLKSADFMVPPRPLKKVSQNNAGIKYFQHVNIALDQSMHGDDRKKSVAHSDYNKHPNNFFPLPPFVAKISPYRHLETDKALPYPGLNRGSEAGNNFTSSFMQGLHALERRRLKEEACNNRASNTKKTHFVMGYEPGSYTSESLHQYNGRKKNDTKMSAAGKTEIRPESHFLHLAHSQNTEDLLHNNPHMTSHKEGIRARHLFRPTVGGNPFETSIMKEDYKAVNKRILTDAHWQMVLQNEKLSSKPTESSHFFHTDNSGTNQYRSVTMHDFIKPEATTGGQKFLAAR